MPKKVIIQQTFYIQSKEQLTQRAEETTPEKAVTKKTIGQLPINQYHIRYRFTGYVNPNGEIQQQDINTTNDGEIQGRK